MPDWLRNDVLDVRRLVTQYLALQDADWAQNQNRVQNASANKVRSYPYLSIALPPRSTLR